MTDDIIIIVGAENVNTRWYKSQIVVTVSNQLGSQPTISKTYFSQYTVNDRNLTFWHFVDCLENVLIPSYFLFSLV